MATININGSLKIPTDNIVDSQYQLKKNIVPATFGSGYCSHRARMGSMKLPNLWSTDWAPCPCHDPCHQDHKHHAQHHGPGVLSLVAGVCFFGTSKYSWYSVDIQNTPKGKPRYCNSHVLTNRKTIFQANGSWPIYFQWNYVCTGRLLGYFLSACGNWDSVLLKPCPDWGHLRERWWNKTYLTMWKLKALIKSVKMHKNSENQGQPWNTRSSL